MNKKQIEMHDALVEIDIIPFICTDLKCYNRSYNLGKLVTLLNIYLQIYSGIAGVIEELNDIEESILSKLINRIKD